MGSVQIARSISPSMSIGPMSAPYVLVPVVAAAQEVNVSMPGEEPELALDTVPEDMRLFDSSLVDKSGGHLRWQRHLLWLQRSSAVLVMPYSCMRWLRVTSTPCLLMLATNLMPVMCMVAYPLHSPRKDNAVGLRYAGCVPGSPLPAAKRKKFFWDPKKRRDRRVTTEHVWTFTMYQHQVDMSKYQLDVALRFDLTRCLDGQPLQFMIKDRFVLRSVSSCIGID